MTGTLHRALSLYPAVAAAMLALAPAQVFAETWAVDPANSRIGFSGKHAGTAFKGTFETWTAEIRFDPQDLANAKADVRVDLRSAVTGDTTYDKTLPTSDWFNTRAATEGRFVATQFEAAADGAFKAAGTLSIRGFEVPVVLDFTFTRDGETARIEGQTRLQRLDFGIGKGSDATGAWVSLDIPVTVDVKLVRDEPAAPPKT